MTRDIGRHHRKYFQVDGKHDQKNADERKMSMGVQPVAQRRGGDFVTVLLVVLPLLVGQWVARDFSRA